MDWIETHQAWFWWLAVASITMLVASPIVVGWVVVRLPSDYFTDKRRRASPFASEHLVLGLVLRIGKNLLGFLLVAAGIVMLFVPGQGLLTIVMGVLLIDFPGKYQLERWLVTRPAVWRSLDWLRKRSGRAPFIDPLARAAPKRSGA